MRCLGATVAAVLAAFTLTASAQAARIVTWETTSRHVDAARATSGYSNPSGTPRPNALRVNVFLPDGYDARSTRRYPVLYLLHGVGDAYDSWSLPRQGDLLEVARGFPGFIVMPEADRGFYTNWWNGGRYGDPAWERYHLDELIPLVEARLPILRARRWHAIYGFSMGGMGALFYASQRPGYFGAAGSSQGLIQLQRPTFQSEPVFRAFIEQDPRAIFGDPAAQEFYWAGHNPSRLVENLRHTRLYVAVGDGVPAPGEPSGTGQAAEVELRMQTDEFVAAARGAGLTVDYRPQQGSHEWISRRKHLRDAWREWGLFEPVSQAPTSWSYRTVAQEGEMWGLRFAFDRPPDVVQVFTRTGDVLRAAGSGTVSVRTPDGCRFTATLPFELRVPSGCAPPARALRLRVKPRRVIAGRRTVIRFRVLGVTGGRRHPIRGALVRFAGRRVRTDGRGRASMSRALPRRGVFRARATKPGWRPAAARIAVATPRRG